MKKFLCMLVVFAMMMTLLAGCGEKDSEADPTSAPTATATVAATATPEATATPTEVPKEVVKDGWYNAAATWDVTTNDDGTQTATYVGPAEAKAGNVIYFNDFEQQNNNFPDGSNSYNYASAGSSDEGIGYESSYSLRIGSRATKNDPNFDTDGISRCGGGVRICDGRNGGANNGINIDDLVGHKIKLSFWIYYYDETTLGCPDTIDFILWNRVNKVTDPDDSGYQRVSTFSVPKDTWTYEEFELEVTDNIPNGLLLIGSEGETVNDLDYLNSFYLDDITITFVE